MAGDIVVSDCVQFIGGHTGDNGCPCGLDCSGGNFPRPPDGLNLLWRVDIIALVRARRFLSYVFGCDDEGVDSSLGRKRARDKNS